MLETLEASLRLMHEELEVLILEIVSQEQDVTRAFKEEPVLENQAEVMSQAEKDRPAPVH
jgi:hypothetical protein